MWEGLTLVCADSFRMSITDLWPAGREKARTSSSPRPRSTPPTYEGSSPASPANASCNSLRCRPSGRRGSPNLRRTSRAIGGIVQPKGDRASDLYLERIDSPPQDQRGCDHGDESALPIRVGRARHDGAAAVDTVDGHTAL